MYAWTSSNHSRGLEKASSGLQMLTSRSQDDGACYHHRVGLSLHQKDTEAAQGPMAELQGGLGLQAAAAHPQATEGEGQGGSRGLRAAWSAPRQQVLTRAVPDSWQMAAPGKESCPGHGSESLLHPFCDCSLTQSPLHT